MSRNPALVLFVALALIAPARAFAQLTPPAGSAGAGNSPISGVPFGPANPRSLSDPSGIGNAGNIPPLRPSPPPPPVSTGAVSFPGAHTRGGDAALCRRLAADRQPASGLPAQAADPAAGAGGDEQLQRHLPGVLGGV